jgi:hypothetical protein
VVASKLGTSELGDRIVTTMPVRETSNRAIISRYRIIGHTLTFRLRAQLSAYTNILSLPRMLLPEWAIFRFSQPSYSRVNQSGDCPSPETRNRPRQRVAAASSCETLWSAHDVKYRKPSGNTGPSAPGRCIYCGFASDG